MPPKNVLITGANGFLGYAVCRAFAVAGWNTYGLLRNTQRIQDLTREEIIPLIGSPANIATFSSKLPPIFDVIIVCSEDPRNYDNHFKDVLYLITYLSKSTKEASNGTKKPLVIFSSGCKDYGQTALHGDFELAPHSEDSPVRPPAKVAKRTHAALSMFAYADIFDCVVTRPTTLYGHSGSYYAYIFRLAQEAQEKHGGVLTINASIDTILHGTHVDDVAAAYLAIATAPLEVVAGQVYNISSHQYETVGDIIPAIEKSHGIRVVLADPPNREGGIDNLPEYEFFFNYSQWVGSDKLRRDTNWRDVKPLFNRGYEVYRSAYNASADVANQHLRALRATPRLA